MVPLSWDSYWFPVTRGYEQCQEGRGWCVSLSVHFLWFLRRASLRRNPGLDVSEAFHEAPSAFPTGGGRVCVHIWLEERFAWTVVIILLHLGYK